MPDGTPRLNLPLIQQSQAQKHVTHNEALAILDLLVQLVVQDFGAETPPGDPQDGQVWALGAAPTGDWSGQANRLAARLNGGWDFWRRSQGGVQSVWRMATCGAGRAAHGCTLMRSCGLIAADVAPPPDALTLPCDQPQRLPVRMPRQGEAEVFWGRDRSKLRECSERHGLLAAPAFGGMGARAGGGDAGHSSSDRSPKQRSKLGMDNRSPRYQKTKAKCTGSIGDGCFGVGAGIATECRRS